MQEEQGEGKDGTGVGPENCMPLVQTSTWLTGVSLDE
jgi:hypothetical protein